MDFILVDTDQNALSQIRELFEEYRTEFTLDLCTQGYEEELAALPGKYAPPGGRLLLVRDEDKPVACGALRDLGNNIGEIKRLYIRPAFRRHGLGRRISTRLIDEARILGYRALYLDTLSRLPGAVELYRSLGFVETAPYNSNPDPDIVYMALDLWIDAVAT